MGIPQVVRKVRIEKERVPAIEEDMWVRASEAVQRLPTWERRRLAGMNEE
jgi:hypothetical protein